MTAAIDITYAMGQPSRSSSLGLTRAIVRVWRIMHHALSHIARICAGRTPGAHSSATGKQGAGGADHAATAVLSLELELGISALRLLARLTLSGW